MISQFGKVFTCLARSFIAPLALLLASLTAPVRHAHAQGGLPLWTNLYNGPARGMDLASAMAVDGNGNLFVTGSSEGVGTGYDYATVAYSNGGATQWIRRYNGPGNGDDYAYAMAVDTYGNLIVTGGAYSDPFNSEYLTVAYSGAGTLLWTGRYAGPGDGRHVARAVASDDGNVYVTGQSPGSNGDSDFATLAYSGSGVPLWTNRYAGPGSAEDIACGVAVDHEGTVYVTGVSPDPLGSWVTIAYSRTGVPLWTNHYSGGPPFSGGIVLDSNANVIITGSSAGSGNPPSDYATIAYSSAGIPLWTNLYNGPGDNVDEGHAVAVDSHGNVFVTGMSYSGNGAWSADYATVAYSSVGVPAWTNRFDGPGNNQDVADAVAVDRSGNVIVTGRAFDPADGVCITTLAYSSEGVPLWTNRYVPLDPNLNAIAQVSYLVVDSGGNVFVAGSIWNGTDYDYATIKYSSNVVPPPYLGFQILNQQLVLSWTNAEFNLEAAPLVTGTFTNVPGATSPYTNSINGLQRFFRLKAN